MNTLYLVCTNGIKNNLEICNLLNASKELSTLNDFNDYDKQYYNDEICNELQIREDQLDALLNISQSKSIALELNANNIQDIFLWSRNKFAVVIVFEDGDFEYDYCIDIDDTDSVYDNLGLLLP